MLHLVQGGYLMILLFLIHWVGGVYILSDGDLEHAGIWTWLLCAFIGWIFIVLYIFDCLGTNGNTSTSSSSSQSSLPSNELSNIPDSDYNSYQNLLKEYYTKYKDQVFQKKTLSEIQQKINFERDLTEIKHDLKSVRKELESSFTKVLKFECSVCGYIYEGDTAPKKCPICGVGGDKFNKLTVHQQNQVGTETALIDYQLYMEMLKQQYSQYGEKMFLPSKIQDFIDSNQLNSKLGIKSDDVMKDLWKIKNKETEEDNITVMLPEQPLNKRTQSANITTLQRQPQSILDEQKLLNYIKGMPVKWDFNNPNALENKEIQKICSILLNTKTVLAYCCPDFFRQMEFVVQKKRANTPKRADYGIVMNKNILFELYKYSYLMNIFKVLESRKNDELKIDRVEFWNLIQEDCRKRLENLEYEKRNTPVILDMFRKYELDTQKVKMVVNDYIEPREYDYIYAYSMTCVLSEIIVNMVFNGEINIGNGYQPTLDVIRQYPASDMIEALDVTIATNVNFSLGMYANGGVLPKKQ